MQKIRLYNQHPALQWTLIVFGIFAVIIGSIELWPALATGAFRMKFLGENWHIGIVLLQGIVFIVQGLIARRNSKYFFAYGNGAFEFCLPGFKGTERIKFAEIDDLHIGLFEIVVNLKGGTKEVIDLHGDISYHNIRAIKSCFEKFVAQRA